MARVQQSTFVVAVMGMAALMVFARCAVAQNASQQESETPGLEGPLLLNANDRATPEEDMPLPAPAEDAPSIRAEGRQRTTVQVSPAPAAVEPARRTARQNIALDDLPPPRESRTMLDSSPRDGGSFFGITLDERVPDAAVVRAVESRSPAARAGLQRGDVIWAINHQRVASMEEAVRVVEEMQPGEPFDINISRDINAQIALDDPAVRSAGYAEELPNGQNQYEAFEEDQTYRSAPYREDARFRPVEEDLPAPAYSRSDNRRRTLYYVPSARDQRERYEPRDDRRDDEDGDRRLDGRERDSQDRPYRNRPLLPWRRN